MIKFKNYIPLLFAFLFIGSNLWAYKPPQRAKKELVVEPREACLPSQSAIEMEVNNVRARLLGGGDVWWDLQDNGRYIVPKVEKGLPEVSSIFAGAVWIGGVDPAKNLKVAAQTYRSDGNDFWPGPLDPKQGTTEKKICDAWDRHFTVTREEIDQFLRDFELSKKADGSIDDTFCDTIPRGVKGWPARGNPYFSQVHNFDLPNTTQGLAGFFDRNGDNTYNPCDGDYPIIEIRGCSTPQYPDEMIFWIYNDAGNIHTQTRGNPIQMEIQVQAFAYKSNDEINNMTFQRYKLINRAVEDIDSTFFAMWVDPDLGCYLDDYIGSDVNRSLAYVYNQDETDGQPGCDCPAAGGSVNTYCKEIPVLGVDYFRGPLNEKGDEIGMSSFIYYNNVGVGTPIRGTTDPETAIEYYRYLSGYWRDGTPMSLGGSGYNPSNSRTVKYAFPDLPSAGTGWSMCTSNLPYGDRRTLQASGPFKLKPGAVNELIIGVVWVPDQEYPCPNLAPLLNADDLAQALFDNCFKITDGPDAPDVDFVELDKELIAIFTNDTLRSNNKFERYEEIDLRAPKTVPDANKKYVFEGYKLYQLSDPTVGTTEVELNDANKARLVAQVDIKNGVKEIYNWNSTSDPNTGKVIWLPEKKVETAKDDGVRHSFKIVEDQFAKSNNKKLTNHKKYYFTAIAYAHNQYQVFDPKDGLGQRRPYLAGRRNIKVYTPIPRPILAEKLNASFGDGAIITRIDGVGVGSISVDMSDETKAAILDSKFDGKIIYKAGKGPIAVKIINPLQVKNSKFELTFVDENMANSQLDTKVRWQLTDLTTNKVLKSETTIEKLNEQIIAEYGFSIGIQQTTDAGDNILTNKSGGVLTGELTYKNTNGSRWLGFINDNDDGTVFDFVKNQFGQIDNALDPNQAFSKVTNGAFVPFYLTDFRLGSGTNDAPFYIGPGWYNNNALRMRSLMSLQGLNNVDIVLTPDKTKWSRCVVVETANPYYYGTGANQLGLPTRGKKQNFDLRSDPSVGKDADASGKPIVDNDGTGMGWFPGYAVDVETGKRLNIFFGENSVYDGAAFDNNSIPFKSSFNNIRPTGGDMIWNPTNQTLLTTGTIAVYNMYAGAQHYIYVMNTEYDQCAAIRTRLNSTNAVQKLQGLKDVVWAGVPIVSPTTSLISYKDGLIPNEATVKLRVDNPYQVSVGTNARKGYPTYQFELKGVAPTIVETAAEINAVLKAIQVVPNPYNAYSEYETSEFTNIVKVTNLPPNCTVTIYALDGKFIRQYKRNEQPVVQRGARANPGIVQSQVTPALEWDLKNHKGIPVASGTYIIHVNSPDYGERIIKWVGVMRQFDPSRL